MRRTNGLSSEINEMKKILVVVVVLVVGAGIFLHPLWRDTAPTKTVRLLIQSDRAGVSLERIFGRAELYCAIGPYDSFQSARFSSQLPSSTQKALDEAVKRKFPDGQSDNQFILAGLDDDKVLFLYRSLFLDKKEMFLTEQSDFNDCVGANGVAVVSRSNRSIFIR